MLGASLQVCVCVCVCVCETMVYVLHLCTVCEFVAGVGGCETLVSLSGCAVTLTVMMFQQERRNRAR